MDIDPFSYVKYDELAIKQQENLRDTFKHLEGLIFDIKDSRYKSLAMTALEETYLWLGKAIREHQIERSKDAP